MAAPGRRARRRASHGHGRGAQRPLPATVARRGITGGSASCALHCSAAQGKTSHIIGRGAQHKPTVALHHRGRRGRSAGGQMSFQHTVRPREPSARSSRKGAARAAHCIAARRKARQATSSGAAPSTNRRWRCIIAATEVAPRWLEPPSRTRETITSRTQEAGRLLFVHWVAAGQRDTTQQPTK